MQMMESDRGNSILPNVRFYEREMQNNYKSQTEGRPVYDMVEFVRIEIPGDMLNIIDQPATKYHKETYPVQWGRFLNERLQNGSMHEISGTLLRDWAILNAAQARELNHFNFYTVDQIAASSDEQLSKIVMIVGMGAHAIREKAKNYLAKAKDSAVLDSQAEELRKRDAEINQLKEQMNSMLAKMQKDDSIGQEVKAKRGRPAKPDTE